MLCNDAFSSLVRLLCVCIDLVGNHTPHHCECAWHVISCSWYAKLGTLQMETNYLLAILLFVCGAESDVATSHSCATSNESIDASNSSLEASITTQHIRGGCE